MRKSSGTARAALCGAVCLAFAGLAQAQYVGPVNPYNPPPSTFPQPTYPQPTYPQPTIPQPVNPGGYNPYPTGYVDPNGIAGGTGSATRYWDPYRGWVTNSQTTTVLNSATSPGRTPMPGTSIQYYNYWNGTQWVRGSRWLGQDGIWHGDHENTVVGPGGSSTNRVVYSANPNATGAPAPGGAPGATTNRVVTAPGTTSSAARPTYTQPPGAVYTQPQPLPGVPFGQPYRPR